MPSIRWILGEDLLRSGGSPFLGDKRELASSGFGDALKEQLGDLAGSMLGFEEEISQFWIGVVQVQLEGKIDVSASVGERLQRA